MDLLENGQTLLKYPYMPSTPPKNAEASVNMLSTITQWFVNSSTDLASAMPGRYDPALVVLSIIVPSLAGYATLNIVGRIRAGNKMISESSWLSIGALTMGIGVWAMHFIAMLAFRLPMPVNYDIWVTLASVFPVILASAVMLYVISRVTCSGNQLIIGGVLMGAGIGVMHYTGMAAMRMDALMRFDPWIFALSVVVAVVLSIAALYVNWWASQKDSVSKTPGVMIGAALVMGFAVSGMHYTGMSAAYFFPGSGGEAIDAMNPHTLSYWVALASILITVSAISMTVFEKRMSSAVGTATVSRARLIEAIESVSDGFALFDQQGRLALMNSRYLELMQLGSRESVVGVTFGEIMHRIARKGVIKEAQEDPDGWVEELLKDWNPDEPQIQQLSDGRWLRINERLVKGIGAVAIYTDITEIKAAEFELSKANEEITELNERLNAENLRLGAEVEVTRTLQRMVLPRSDELQAVPGLDIAAYMDPADEVGGDYYDVLQHNGKFKIGMGDVTGHGLESGVLMLMTQMGIRTLMTSDESDPSRFLDVLNRTLYNNVQRMGIDKSLTLLLIDYTPPDGGSITGKMRVSGQHEELIVVRQGGKIDRIDTIDLGFPVALDEDIADFVDHVDIELHPGDGVVLYTDGITEAENSDGVQYALEKLCSVISDHWTHPAETIKQTIIDDVKQHIGSHTVFDDITLLVVKQKRLHVA